MGARRGKWIVGILAVATVALVAGPAWYHWPRLVFAWRFESLGLNVQGYPEYRHRWSGIIFVRLPGGTFEMGSPADEEGREEDEILHTVTLSPFLIAKTEVSQGQWRRVMGVYSNPSTFGPDDQLPVENVSWDDCQAFLTKLNGGPMAGALGTSGFQLPTEAQWEYACRAGKTTPFSFGATITPEQVNYNGNYPYGGAKVGLCRSRTVEVGSLPANQFGLHEMHGNVFEWCMDWFAEDFYQKPESRGLDPCNHSRSGSRVSRGGCCLLRAEWCRSADRGGDAPVGRRKDRGFRPAYFPLPPGL